MDIRDLEYFIAIAEEKNLSHAAAKLYTGQPTLTKFVHKIEKKCGTPLFTRSGRELQLTYAGSRFEEYARQMLAVSRNLDNEMDEIRNGRAGSLSVGIPPVRCSIILPLVLPGFHENYPQVSFSVMEDASENLDEALLDGRIDLAFYGMSMPRKELTYETILEDRMCAVVRKGHPISEMAITLPDGSREIEIEWLKNEVFLLQTRRQRQGQYMWRVIADRKVKPAGIQEHSNIRAALSLAAGGYGVTFVSRELLKYLDIKMDYDSYALKGITRPIYFVAAMKKNRFLPAYASGFTELVRAAMGRG